MARDAPLLFEYRPVGPAPQRRSFGHAGYPAGFISPRLSLFRRPKGAEIQDTASTFDRTVEGSRGVVVSATPQDVEHAVNKWAQDSGWSQLGRPGERMAFVALRHSGGWPVPDIHVHASPSEGGHTHIRFAASWEMLWGPNVDADVQRTADLFAAAVCDELREKGFSISVPGHPLPCVNRARLRFLERARRAGWRALIVAAVPVVAAAIVLYHDNELLLWSIICWLAFLPLFLVYFRWRIIGMRLRALGLYVVFMLLICAGLALGGIAVQLWG